MARRLGSVLVALSVTAAGWLSAPTAALAVDTYGVTFPAATEGEYGLIASANMGVGSSCTPSGTGINYPGADTWPATANLTLYRTNFGAFHGTVWTDGPTGCRMHASTAVTTWAYRFDPTVGTSYQFQFVWIKNASSYCTPNLYWVGSSGTVIGTSLGMIQASDCSNDGGTEYETVASNAPSGAVGVAWSTVEASTFIGSLLIEGQEESTEGGDCVGVGELAGGSVWVNAANWGSYWWEAHEVCRSSVVGTITRDLFVSGDYVEDELYTVSATFCTDGNARSVTFNFLTLGGEQQTIESGSSSRTCASGLTTVSGYARAPAGTTAIRVYLQKYVHLHELTLVASNVDPDELPDGVPRYDPGCEAPDGGWLDLDWLSYIGCQVATLGGLPGLIADALWITLGAPIYTAITGVLMWVEDIAGFILDLPELIYAQFLNMFITGPLSGLAQFLLDNIAFLAEIAGHIVDLPDLIINGLWTALGSPIYTAVNGTLDYLLDLVDLATALPGAIAEAFGTTLSDVLEFLFVPTPATGEAFEDFLSSADDRAPVGWIVEVVTYLNGMLTAGNLAGPGLALSFPIMGATVSYDPSPITEAFAPYRPVGVAVVYLTLAMAAWRSIGRGLAT